MDECEDYIGSLQGAPASLAAALTPLAVNALFRETEWSRGCYSPRQDPKAPYRIAVLFQPFAWDADAQRTWLMTSIGLSAHEQGPPPVPGHRAFRRIELAACFHEPAGWDEFHRAWDFGTLDSFGRVPGIVASFASVALSFASWIVESKDAFGFGDPVQDASFAGRQFPSALVVPPSPELLVSGLRPWRAGESKNVETAHVEAADWSDHGKLLDAGEAGFVQLAPLMSDELDEAMKGRGLPFFHWGLLPTDDEYERGMDSSHHIANLQRGSRLQAFRSSCPA